MDDPLRAFWIALFALSTPLAAIWVFGFGGDRDWAAIVNSYAFSASFWGLYLSPFLCPRPTNGAAASATTIESRHAMVGALRPHPIMTALVALSANDSPAMVEAVRLCGQMLLFDIRRRVPLKVAAG